MQEKNFYLQHGITQMQNLYGDLILEYLLMDVLVVFFLMIFFWCVHNRLLDVIYTYHFQLLTIEYLHLLEFQQYDHVHD